MTSIGFVIYLLEFDVFREDFVRMSGQDDGALHDIAELSNIARPIVTRQFVQRVMTENSSAMSGHQDKVRSEIGDVFPALPERRKLEYERVDAVQEVPSEKPVVGRLFQIPAGRRNKTKVRGDTRSPPEPPEFSRFEHPEEFRLKRGGRVADFIEEQQAASREFEGPGAGHRIGEGPALSTEKFAFGESVGYGGAVARDKGPGSSAR